MPLDAEVVAEARRAWPGVDVPDADFDAYVAAHTAHTGDAARVRVTDLYLACACARGDAGAVALFERTYFGEIDAAARRARAGDDIAAEARQNLARTLFTGDPPAVSQFSGRGDLRGWLRVAAMREVLRLLELSKRQRPVGDDALLDAMSPAQDPELGLLKDRYRAEVQAAFDAALATLSPRDRGLLRHSLIDGLSIDELGKLHQVHRATAARWLQGIRDALLDRTREELAARLGAGAAEVESVIRLVASRLDVSLERVL